MQLHLPWNCQVLGRKGWLLQPRRAHGQRIMQVSAYAWLKWPNEAYLLLNNGQIKKSCLIADNRCKISAFNICRIHIPYILHIGMLKHWPLRLGIDIWWIKLKSPNHVRYRLSVRLWGVEVLSASKRSTWTSGVKNITVCFKLTRSCGDCWPSCPILPLINKIKIVSDIGWSPAISAWDCHLIHDNPESLHSPYTHPHF